MNDSLTLRRLRAFLLGLAALLFLGTVIELLTVGHAEDPIQITPYALCGLGLVALAAVRARPGRRTIAALRITMAAILVGSVVGVALHFHGNLELGRETQPNASAARLLVAALTGGTPLLAPGILALGAALAVAATYSAGPGEAEGSA